MTVPNVLSGVESSFKLLTPVSIGAVCGRKHVNCVFSWLENAQSTTRSLGALLTVISEGEMVTGGSSPAMPPYIIMRNP